jgi:hypothetical protein
MEIRTNDDEIEVIPTPAGVWRAEALMYKQKYHLMACLFFFMFVLLLIAVFLRPSM